MSWVRKAIDGIKASPYEELYPTAYGHSAEKPDIFWALNPAEVPRPVQIAVETAVRQHTIKDNVSCAIVRLETLAGYYDGLKNKNTVTTPDKPVGHFAIYLGTSPANTALKTHLPTGLGDPGSAAEEQDDDGARTPSMSEIEEEYSQVENKSKRGSNRLSKIKDSVGNWVRLN